MNRLTALMALCVPIYAIHVTQDEMQPLPFPAHYISAVMSEDVLCTFDFGGNNNNNNNNK
jgi:hypothetical protein